MQEIRKMPVADLLDGMLHAPPDMQLVACIKQGATYARPLYCTACCRVVHGADLVRVAEFQDEPQMEVAILPAGACPECRKAADDDTGPQDGHC